MSRNTLLTRSLLTATLALGIGLGGVSAPSSATTLPSSSQPAAVVLPAGPLPSCVAYSTREYRPWWNLFQKRVEATVTNRCRVPQVFRIHKVNSWTTCNVVNEGKTRTVSVAKSDYRGHVGNCND